MTRSVGIVKFPVEVQLTALIINSVVFPIDRLVVLSIESSGKQTIRPLGLNDAAMTGTVMLVEVLIVATATGKASNDKHKIGFIPTGQQIDFTPATSFSKEYAIIVL